MITGFSVLMSSAGLLVVGGTGGALRMQQQHKKDRSTNVPIKQTIKNAQTNAAKYKNFFCIVYNPRHTNTTTRRNTKNTRTKNLLQCIFSSSITPSPETKLPNLGNRVLKPANETGPTPCPLSKLEACDKFIGLSVLSFIIYNQTRSRITAWY
jgi:hypothetical protein